jgi:hypothetical protein
MPFQANLRPLNRPTHLRRLQSSTSSLSLRQTSSLSLRQTSLHSHKQTRLWLQSLPTCFKRLPHPHFSLVFNLSKSAPHRCKLVRLWFRNHKYNQHSSLINSLSYRIHFSLSRNSNLHSPTSMDFNKCKPSSQFSSLIRLSGLKATKCNQRSRLSATSQWAAAPVLQVLLLQLVQRLNQNKIRATRYSQLAS